ncbi:ABC transporter permease [Nocardioides gilvus]|uniref:ABC transporter permease n=1 Tax=Nocardioides gilvus TaxID=1735589 RepID=UPI000D742AB1|nr:ABC transporter permease subunit [Nocardioides gilvus]
MSVSQHDLALAQVQPRIARPRIATRAKGPVVLGALGILGFLLTWELFSRLGPVDPHYLPPPSLVLPQFFTNFTYTDFWVAIAQTMRAWAIGLTVAVASAVVVGVVIGSSDFLRRATHSTIEFLRPIPAVALIPVAALLYGPELQAELLIIVYACFWLVLVQVLYGVADVDNVARDTALVMQMNFLQRVRHLVFPTLLPYLMTGVRLAAVVALILAVGVELIVGTPGLGQKVALAQINDANVQMYSLILASGVLGMAVNGVMTVIERKSLFWHESVRGGKS